MNTTIRKTAIKFLAPWLAAGALGAAIALAPIAAAATGSTTQTGPTSQVGTAGTDPLVPFGTDPSVPYRLGYINPNHDDGTFPNGWVDVPF